jgi:hypothetical protein
MKFRHFLFSWVLLPFFAQSAFAQGGCKNQMPGENFGQYLSAIQAESFSSNKMEIAKQDGICLSTIQIRSVIDQFSFESEKLDFAKWAYTRCSDPGNYFMINSGLTYSASKTELSKYIKSVPKSAQTTEEEPVTRENTKLVPPSKTKQPSKVQEPRQTGWIPDVQDNEDLEKQSQNDLKLYDDEYKKAMDRINSFFVMSVGGDENMIDKQEDIHKPNEDESALPAKAPRIMITEPELTEESNYTAKTQSKKQKVSGVISSTIGIYEIFVNDVEAVLNQKGEFFADILLAPGINEVKIKAKDTKGQVSKIAFKVERLGAKQEVVVKNDPPVEPPKVEPKANEPFVSEVDQNIPKLKMSNKDAIAVVIGNAQYSKTKPVDFAVNDARSMKQYLIQVLGFRDGNILYYENATLGEFNTVFGTKGNPKGRLFNTIKQNVSDVVIFYSGHGAPGLKDNKAYFVPVEADPNYMENSGFCMDILYENLKKLPAKSITLFSDACFSGANVFEKISPMVIRSKEPVKEGLKNTSLLNSCTGTEVSCWHNEERHGLFTFFLLKAMKEYEQTDKNNDKQITLGELFDSVSDNNEAVPYYARRNYGLTQTPVLQGSKAKVLFKY